MMSVNKSAENMSIPEFYKDKSVFITGGMGFLGKVMIEKILRSCPDVVNVYLLVRSKKGKKVEERIGEILNSPVFDNLRQNQPDQLKKIVLLEGDVAMDELGLSKENQKLICDKVSIILHSAATVNFNEPLKVAIKTNLQPMKELIKLSRQIKDLKAFVHISTAYTNWFHSDTEEKIYPTDYEPNDLIEMANRMSQEELDKLAPKMLGKHVNTYTFTKTHAEMLLSKEATDLPVAIVRPSMVIGSNKEPFSGWIDNFYGPTFFVFAISKGLMGSMHLLPKGNAEIVPVDMTVNMILTSAWNVASKQSAKSSPMIFHSTTCGQDPLTWKKFLEICINHSRKYPLEGAIWYPSVICTTNYFLYTTYTLFAKFLPAYVIDGFTKLAGKKPKLVKFEKMVGKHMELTKWAPLNPIRFKNENYKGLISSMNPKDRVDFDFNFGKLNWNEYLERYYLGMRQYLLKQSPATIPVCAKNMQRLKFARSFLIGSSVLVPLAVAAGYYETQKSKNQKVARRGSVEKITFNDDAFVNNLL